MVRKSLGLVVLCFASVVGSVFADSAASQAALPTAEVFAPGVISNPANDGAPTFSPDGNTLYFTRSTAKWSIILESKKMRGQWSNPTVAVFSGMWSDSSPAMSPDGSFLIYISVRPLVSPGMPTSGASPRASHIWRVNRRRNGWSDPVELPESVNFCPAIFRPSVAADGTVYFTALPEKGKNLSLFRAKFENGAYLKAEPLSFSDGTLKDVDPEIAPDQSFLIFSSRGRWSDENAHEHLFIVHSKDGVWGPVVPIRYSGDDANGSSDDNDPRLGLDHKTIYFSSDRAIPVHFPRTKEQAQKDYERMEMWDNSNSNVWMLKLP